MEMRLALQQGPIFLRAYQLHSPVRRHLHGVLLFSINDNKYEGIT
jgi:hypothetical protein